MPLVGKPVARLALFAASLAPANLAADGKQEALKRSGYGHFVAMPAYSNRSWAWLS